MSRLSYPAPAKLKVLLVDDEEIARQRLRQLLQAYNSQIEIIGEAQDGEEARQQIELLRPDVVFLDIEMPGKSGLQLLKELRYLPLIVFVTAYEQYAVKAFEEDSLDYLLKPVEKTRLATTMQRLISRQKTNALLPEQLEQLLQRLQPAPKELKVIPVKTGDQIVLVSLADVIFFEARDKYVTLHLRQKTYLLDQSLTYLEERLPAGFIRVQRGFILNQQKIKEIRKYFNGRYLFKMTDAAESTIKSGHTYHERLQQLFEL